MNGRGIAAVLSVSGVLMLAGVVHIVSLLAMPAVAPDDAYARVARIAPEDVVTILPRAGGPGDPVRGRDPSTATAVCRYNLGRGPLRVSAALGGQLYAALSLHGRASLVFYGLNDRAGNNGHLDLVVMTAAQITAAAARDTPDAPVRDVRVMAPEPQGFVTFDVLPRIGGYPAAVEGLASMRCEVERQP